MKLKTVGPDIDLYKLPKNKWTMNTDMWHEIAYPAIQGVGDDYFFFFT